MHKVLLIHGPNLDQLGVREPAVYGNITSEGILSELKTKFSNVQIDYFQSASESELIAQIHRSNSECSGVIINAGAYSHSSIAIADAIRSIQIPVFSVHISNIYSRENYRHQDIVGDACKGCIVGLGQDGYTLAFECLLDELNLS